MLVAPLRSCASRIAIGNETGPNGVPGGTAAVNVNALPLAANDCAADPPIALRSPVTVMPVLAGFVPGVTLTLRSALLPGVTDAGVAVPVPVGDVVAAVTVSAIVAA